MPMTPRRSERWLDSPCTPVWRPKPTSVTSWNGCAATSPDRTVPAYGSGVLDMSDISALVVFASPYGPLAFSVEDFRAGLEAGRKLADQPNLSSVDNTSRDYEGSRLIDAAGAADLLGVNPSWLLQHARENRLPYHRVGKYIRFDIDELLSFTRCNRDRHANS